MHVVTEDIAIGLKRGGRTSRGGQSITVIVPTRNEAENVEVLTQRLAATFSRSGLDWELVFVDDSDDETPERIAALRDRRLPVTLVHRQRGERQGGLSGAVVEGFLAARGEVLVVMDGDLQHPPELALPLALALFERGQMIAIGSRYLTATGSSGLAGPLRRFVSQASRLLVRALFPSIRKIRDPLSGLFALHRSVLFDVQLVPEGFKILLEILVRANWDEAVEIPYGFAERHGGSSKAGWIEGIHFLRHLLRLRLLAPHNGKVWSGANGLMDGNGLRVSP